MQGSYMFKKKTKRLVGANQKLENARKMNAAGYYDVDTHHGSASRKNAGGQAQYPSQTYFVAVIFVLSVVIAIMINSYGVNPLNGAHITGISLIDQFITGTGHLQLTGSAQNDELITIFARGTAFFLMAGIVPIIAALLEVSFLQYRVRPWVTCWFFLVVLMLFHLEGHNIIHFFQTI